MNIRPVNRDDRDEWQRMRARLFPGVDVAEIDEWYAAAASGGTHPVGAVVLVADRGDGRLAGFAEIGIRGYAEGCETTPVAYLEAWYVDPDARRAGTGRRLVEAAEAWAAAQGFSEMASDSELDNDNSRSAHLALGFEEIERQICYRKRLRRRTPFD